MEFIQSKTAKAIKAIEKEIRIPNPITSSEWLTIYQTILTSRVASEMPNPAHNKIKLCRFSFATFRSRLWLGLGLLGSIFPLAGTSLKRGGILYSLDSKERQQTWHLTR